MARIKSELDLRRFPPIPRMTKQFERLYKGRTAVERVNARLKLYWGADDGNVVGRAGFTRWRARDAGPPGAGHDPGPERARHE